MDAPNYGFQLIQRFPIDILAGIVWFVPGEDIGRLKMTGCKSLWSILTCPNVVKSVKLGEGGIRFKTWPPFMNEFPSLESLRIENEFEQWWRDLGLTIIQLPSTLRRLSLLPNTLDWSCDRFFELPRYRTIQLADHLPHLEVLELRGGEATNFDWALYYPPSLTRLDVDHWRRDVALPSSLISFKTVHGMPAVFPRSLESLNYGRGRYAHSLPALTSLNACLGNGKMVKLENVVSLPQSITNLVVNDWTLPSVTWPSLPAKLQSLLFNISDAKCTVKSRMVDPISGKVHQVETLPLELLPKSLTKLQITGRCIFVSGSCSSLFPPHLKTFEAKNLRLAPNAAKQLPSSLTHLSTCNFYEELCEHLPAGLTSLSFYNTLLSPKTIERLPKSLTKINWRFLSSESGKEEWFDYTTGKMIPSSSLPEYSVHKDYSSYFACLPPNLTSVELWSFRELQDGFIENQNFSNLLSLTLWEIDQLSDHCIPLLNRHLTHLCVGSSPKITGKCFESLPKSLLFLRLGTSSSIVDEDIQHLPRTLKNIQIPIATELTDACIRYFPRGCKGLNISENTKLSLQCLPDVPLSVSSLYVANWMLRGGKVTRLR